MIASFDWGIFLRRIYNPGAVFLWALATTVTITVVAQFLGIVIGLFTALARRSALWPLQVLARTYSLVVRGTPIIVQIFFVYYGANLFAGFNLFPQYVSLFGFRISGAVVAGMVALAINEGAYMSEIIRSGIDSVPRGQREAARSLGMSNALTMRRIVLPQAARVIIPPLGNDFNIMLKATSLLFFIGVYEMFADTQLHYSATFKPAEYFSAVAIWYLVLTSAWTLIQQRIEQRFALPDGNGGRTGRKKAKIGSREDKKHPEELLQRADARRL